METIKYNLKNITFVIPFFFDHQDRLDNINTIIDFLLKNFNTNIIVKETGFRQYFTRTDVDYIFESKNEIIHRTKILNEMVRRSSTPYFCNYDCDVILPIDSYLLALNKLESGTDIVYPYTKFLRIDRNECRSFIHSKNLNDLIDKKDINPNSNLSYGGCIFFNKDSFIQGGLENENFVSWGAEDQERYLRFSTLGYKVERLEGNLYHINHHMGINSGGTNPYFELNEKEFEKIKEMSKEQLVSYIKTWGWI